MSQDALALPTLDEIRKAATRIRPFAFRTPLVRLGGQTRRIYLKLENLQPIGSFKVRCAANALLSRGPLAEVETASAGNFAQGLAYVGRELGIRVTTFVPETAAQTKLNHLAALGARIVKRSYADWWSMMENPPRGERAFIHPVAETAVMAGNGTIGLEIAEDLPDVETVYAPFGGGGLAVGIAAAIHALKPNTKVFACESEAGTPVAAAFAAGEPVKVPFDPNTFITGMGSSQVLPAMWPLIRTELAGATCSSLSDVARAVRTLLQHNHVLAEGAGAAPVAAALAAPASGGPAVCIVSGGHLDLSQLRRILEMGER